MSPEHGFDDWHRRLDDDGRGRLVAMLPPFLRDRANRRPRLTATLINALIALAILAFSIVLVPDSHSASLGDCKIAAR